MSLVGLDPTGDVPPVRREGRSEQPRLESLEGAVVGLVVNGLGESEAFFGALYDELRVIAPVGPAVTVIKGSVSVPPDPTDWERLISEVTVAVAGFGG
jgi:hypothetical protein